MRPFLSSIFLCLALIVLSGTAYPVLAAEPVKVRVKGVEGEALKNVEAALSPPEGLLRDGTVDRLWLDHYAAQAETKTRTALEPFGYYHAMVSTALTGSEEDGFVLNVMVATGDPVRLTEVKVEAHGPGASEEALKTAVAAFPLTAGDVLLHRSYETGKGGIL
jgi:translocation and assembly module TamA